MACQLTPVSSAYQHHMLMCPELSCLVAVHRAAVGRGLERLVDAHRVQLALPRELQAGGAGGAELVNRVAGWAAQVQACVCAACWRMMSGMSNRGEPPGSELQLVQEPARWRESVAWPAGAHAPLR